MDKTVGIYYKRSWICRPAAEGLIGEETLLHELRFLLDGRQAIFESTYKKTMKIRLQ
ncbi:MAG: hypothetical protein LBF24_02010 [Puniceicoccales bacterium]|jgi:hypothetical protein|nr:hypothetical protein [Puniceicoccales bacterium]